MPHKKILKIFVLSAFLVTTLRTAQLFFTIDAATGFSVNPYYEKINIILYAITVLLIAIPSFFSAVSSNRQPTRAPIPKSFPLLTVFNFSVAIYLFASVVITYKNLQTLTIFALIELIMTVLSAIWFMIYGIAGIKEIKLPAILSISPIFLCMLRLINVFVGYNGLANISENLIETLFLCSLLLFFLLQSKIICKVTIRKSSRIIFTVAIVVFMLMLIKNIPPLVIILIGKSNLLHSSSSFSLEYLLLATYAFSFTMQLYSKTKWPPSIHSHSTERLDSTGYDAQTKFIINPNENI